MDMNKSFGVDKASAEEGKWFDLEMGGKVKVSKLSCLAFKTEVVRLQKPHLALLQSTMDSSEILNDITITAMSRTILLDWSDINLDGEPLEHSVDNAKMLMTEYPDFTEVISGLATDRRNFMPTELAGK